MMTVWSLQAWFNNC